MASEDSRGSELQVLEEVGLSCRWLAHPIKNGDQEEKGVWEARSQSEVLALGSVFQPHSWGPEWCKEP